MTPDSQTLRHFFDSVAPSYDRINSLLSFRLDGLWRRRATRLVLNGKSDLATILDLGVGTGKFLKGFFQKKSWRLAVGVDFAIQMLQRARNFLPTECSLIQADIHELPFRSDSFDLVISSFTLRSVKDRTHFLNEVRRILKCQGRVGFLCLTQPDSWVMKALYAPYLKFYLPFLGGRLSANPEAYQFLSESIRSFPSPPQIGRELESVGFQKVSIFPFTFGISTFLTAQK